MTPIAGVIDEPKVIRTAKGDTMAFVKISDLTDTLEMVVFPKTYLLYKEILTPNTPLQVNGKVSHRNGEVSLIVDTVKKL